MPDDTRYRPPPELASPDALARLAFRAAIWDELQAGSGRAYRRFRPADIELLATRLEQYEAQAWTPQAVRAARHDPVARAILGDQLGAYFGQGRRTRSPWSIMAVEIAALTLAAFLGAEKPAGRRDPSLSASVIVEFVHRRLTRIASFSGAKAPSREAVRKTLDRARRARLSKCAVKADVTVQTNRQRRCNCPNEPIKQA
jgi:hypothetical protein